MHIPVRPPWRLLRVSGPSMVPTLRDGDVIVMRVDGHVEAGDVVVARYRGMADRLVVKRAVRPVDGGWWLASDNAAAGGDSAVHGVADVRGRVVVRLRDGFRVGPVSRRGA